MTDVAAAIHASRHAPGGPDDVGVGVKVAKAGDTMTGPLVLSGNPATALQAAPKQYVDTVLTTAESYTDTKITALVGGAGSALDTLAEIDAQMAADEGSAAALAATVATKAATTYVDAQDAATLATATGRAVAFALVLGG